MEKNKPDNKEWEVNSRKLLKSHGYADGDGNAKRVLDNARLTQDLARDILRLSHHTLFINLRFMEAAFIKIVPDHDMDTLTMATDGRFLYYNAAHICRLYQKERGLPARDYLHTVLHCVFRHLFISKKIDGPIWDLACDIAVENLINKMNLKSLSCERETAQAWLIRDLAGKLPRLSAEWIYKYFMEENISDVEIDQLRRNFMADDHSIWHNKTILEEENQDKEENAAGDEDDDSSGKKRDDNEGIGEDLPPDGEEGEDAGQSDEVLSVVESEEGGGIGGEGEGNSDREDRKPALKPAELRDRWKEIA
ncbi:MAG: hypothetical protein IJ137_01170, partial [Eubacterium sp.]|nr:hypothetical protein [Eubacterium sp.]